MKIRFLLTALLLFAATGAYAQEMLGSIQGKVVTRNTRAAIDGAKVTINTPLPRSVFSQRGEFVIKDVPYGTWELTFEASDFITVRHTIKLDTPVRDVALITLSPESGVPSTEGVFTEFDSEMEGAQEMPVTLSASKDVFNNVASYKFSAMRFRTRGYDNSTEAIYLNGVYFNDAQTGYGPWSLWGGLNEATRNQESTMGMAPSDYGLGTMNGTNNVNATASQLRQGFRGSLVNGNGQYLFRGMVTYASGENDKGWSYALSFSTRQGGNLWVDATDYNNWSYFGSVEKRLNSGMRLALTFFGAPTERGVQGASTQEVYDMLGDNYYNPNWGYTTGTYSTDGTNRMIKGDQMRNSRVRTSHEPVVMANYTWDINARNRLLASAAYRFGYNRYSALDWYDAPDPRPDYYRYLPSYSAQPDDEAATGQNGQNLMGATAEGWLYDLNIRQVNWRAMYDINRNSIKAGNEDPWRGLAGTDGLSRAKYVIEDRHTDQNDLNLKVQLASVLKNNFKVTSGLEYRWNKTAYFKTMKDLLGADAWLDIDQFAERDNINSGNPDLVNLVQNDLNHPNRLIRKGDKYGYNYYSQLRSERLWALARYNHAAWETALGVELGNTTFWRDGQYRKGLFPDDSYGESTKQNFFTYSVKGTATYKISGQHVVWANAGYFTRAPYFQYAMTSPRTRNDFLPGLTTEKTLSADVNYSLRLPFVKARVSAYYTQINDQTDVISFYDDSQRTFCNFAMRGIDQSHMGIELGVEVPLIYDITAKGALSLGEYVYTSNPLVTETADNNANVLIEDKPVYWKDFHVAGSPQTAVDLGLDWRGPNNIFAGIDVAYFAGNYISMNPARRTDIIYESMSDQTDPEAMRHQEKFDNAMTLNANIGKVWYFKSYSIGFSLDVKNILNSTDIKTGGYEQMRLRKITPTSSSPEQYYYKALGSKYYYMFGTTYYLNVYCRF